MRNVFFVLLVVFFSGCGHSAYNQFTHDESYYEVLRNSQRAHLVDNFDTKAIVSATYLNNVDQKYTDDEYFMVGLYIVDDFKDKAKRGINNPLFNLTLNGKEPQEVKELSQDDVLVKTNMFVDRWSRYYLVRFARSSKKLSLNLYSEQLKSFVVLSFVKN